VAELTEAPWLTGLCVQCSRCALLCCFVRDTKGEWLLPLTRLFLVDIKGTRTQLLVFLRLQRKLPLSSVQIILITSHNVSFKVIHLFMCCIIEEEINRWPSNTTNFVWYQYSCMFPILNLLIRKIETVHILCKKWHHFSNKSTNQIQKFLKFIT